MKISPTFTALTGTQRQSNNNVSQTSEVSELTVDQKLKLAISLRNELVKENKKEVFEYKDLMLILGYSKSQIYGILNSGKIPVVNSNGNKGVSAINLALWCVDENLVKPY